MNVMASNFEVQTPEAFAEKVVGIIDQGAVAFMLAVGHRLSLFDALAGQGFISSEELAVRTGLAERYVREWLAVMVTGGIVTYRPEDRRYRLPDTHAACLTRGASHGNLAVYAQHVALMGAMQDRVLDCFRTGKGTVYDHYPCFHQIMDEDSEQTVAAGLFAHILPLVAGIEERLAAGIDVFDAGCGRGRALIEMARKFPNSRFVGMDFSQEAIHHANATARAESLSNVTFEVRDLTGYREDGRFDFITTFDAVHDQKDPEAFIRGLKASLKPGGVYLMQDIGGSASLENNIGFPMASMLYAVSCVHCTPISLGQGGAGLGTMWGWETAEAMLKAAGFRSVERHVLPHDPMNVWFVSRT